MTFKTVETVLSATVAASGTLTLPYPSGSGQADFDPAGAHLATISGAQLTSAGSDFSLTFGGSTITFTNGASNFTLPIGATLRVQMVEFTADIIGLDVGFTNVDVGASGDAGTLDIFPATASKGKLRFSATDNVNNQTTTIKNAAQSGTRQYLIPDAGSNANFVMTLGAQSIGGVKTFSSIPVLPTGGMTVGTTTLTEAELAVLDSMNAPVAELQSVDPSQKVTLFDDFTYAVFDANVWSDGEGADTTGAVGPAIVADTANGAWVASSGDDDNAAGSADTSGTTGIDLNWLADNGGLVMEARIKVDDVTNCAFFVGFTDAVLADGSMEAPIEASGSGDVITAEAEDAAGIIYATDFATNPTKINLGSVIATAVTTVVVGAATPVNDTYLTLRVTISAAGVLEGFVNGTSIGTISSAITTSDPLTPAVLVRGRTTATRDITCDYIWVQQDR